MKRQGIVIGVVNIRGGVGKTTISLNLSHILSRAGYKVLHIDNDPQGSSSEILRPVKENGGYLKKDEVFYLDTFSLLTQPVNVLNYIFSTDYENLDVIPNARSTKEFFEKGSFDLQFGQLDYAGKYTAFYENINTIRDAYDFIIIDNQPALSEMLKLGIIASDYVLTPAGADLFNINTVADTHSFIELCNKKYNRKIEYLGFFLNRVTDLKDDGYCELVQFLLKTAKEFFINIPIRFSKSIDKAGMLRMPWLVYTKKNMLISFPNPCKDLLKLMYKELQLIDDEHKEILMKNEKNIKASYFE